MAGVQGEPEQRRPCIALDQHKTLLVLHMVMHCLSGLLRVASCQLWYMTTSMFHFNSNCNPCVQPSSQLIKCFRGTNGLPSRTVNQVCRF